MKSGAAYAILLAAGEGRRYQAGEGKGLALVGGRPLMAWSLSTFASHPRIRALVLVLPPAPVIAERVRPVMAAIPGLDESRILLAQGGETRVASARNGLAALRQGFSVSPDDAVLIHDAARPLVTAALIDRCIDALADEGTDGVVPALPVRETIKRVGEGLQVVETIARAGLWSAQTPQGFRLAALARAQTHGAPGREFTDDASMLEDAGMRVRVIPGETENVKVTVPEDRVFVERVLRERGLYDGR